jgi:hypothetical protein
MEERMDREAQIRQRAHEIWETEGRPDGRHAEHWARATEEFDSRGGQPSAQPQAQMPAGGLPDDGASPAAGSSDSGGSGKSKRRRH